jgi:benzoate 4-monooxygenase
MSYVLADRSGAKRDLDFEELVAESIVFLNAGSDTTAAAYALF